MFSGYVKLATDFLQVNIHDIPILVWILKN